MQGSCLLLEHKLPEKVYPVAIDGVRLCGWEPIMKPRTYEPDVAQECKSQRLELLD